MLAMINQAKSLIHCIANHVASNFTANKIGEGY
ncbi:hydroxyethylthiazole kinase [Ureibacillus aquaedulcis]|uniref:Hydroxyethylthiazole kinase n=1 Tax=Ureibacillus aquaedulcis TaxID=3058421 RepID=A0ABT8GRH2_9BACL|nr:hydroxyethylthiazole kinase [Ureibacillus sp. BA0131]MDN4493982.1 hydroxyethylthiazole kinase [Ureibacillus sp. BA0131]